MKVTFAGEKTVIGTHKKPTCQNVQPRDPGNEYYSLVPSSNGLKCAAYHLESSITM